MTIRLRLTLWYTALLGATLILFSFIFYSALSVNLWTQAQQDAARQADEVANAISQQLKGNVVIIRINPTRIQFPDLEFFTSSVGVQIIDTDGKILKRSNNLGPIAVRNYLRALPFIRAGEPHRFYTTSDSGIPLLVHSQPILVDKVVLGAVQVIKPIASLQDTLGQVNRYLIFGAAFGLVLAAIVGAFLARRALAPIDTITQTAYSISQTTDLSQRLSIVDDASEVGRLAATFNQMLTRIQQLFTTQQRLIADVSHELRTPLTTVRGNIELLRRVTRQTGADPARAELTAEIMQESLAEVEHETTRMGKMINDLLLLAQTDSGAAQFQMEPVELDTLLLDVYRQTRRLVEHANHANSLEIRLGAEDQALVIGDPERLRQVLLNLADNAIKYTPSGGTITFSLEKHGDWVAVSVSDTGIGISPEDQAHIFDRFYRTDRARSRELGGSGLGLSIVTSIVEAHHGQVTVQSELQKGSTFTLWLPTVDNPAQAMSARTLSPPRLPSATNPAETKQESGPLSQPDP